jgi:hypothetical protein
MAFGSFMEDDLIECAPPAQTDTASRQIWPTLIAIVGCTAIPITSAGFVTVESAE